MQRALASCATRRVNETPGAGETLIRRLRTVASFALANEESAHPAAYRLGAPPAVARRDRCAPSDRSNSAARSGDEVQIYDALDTAANDARTVLDIMLSASEPDDARRALDRRYGFTETQALAVMDVQFRRSAHVLRVHPVDGLLHVFLERHCRKATACNPDSGPIMQVIPDGPNGRQVDALIATSLFRIRGPQLHP